MIMMEKEPIFWKYLEFYPYEDEEDYDGVHNGGIKGISENAPDEMKEEFEKYQKEMEIAENRGVKL